MKTIIEAKDIEILRNIMRRAGCEYRGEAGWFCASGAPTFIDYDSATGNWFTVIQ